eukprot:c6995_g2_i3.p1 GENE.c6995_g2_i3~~c6995_g2_i3.p1  ORF type:complete len:241 (+),score=52.80 c6995_g2_i3:1-723(+)
MGDTIMNLVDTLVRDKEAQKVLLEAQKKSNLNLHAHLIMPIQRVPRLEMLLKSLLEHTDPNTTEFRQLNLALFDIKLVAAYCNQKKQESDKRYQLCTIALKVKNIPDTLNILDANRQFIHEGPLRVYVPDTKMLHSFTFFLFDSMMMWVDTDPIGDMTYKGSLSLETGKFHIERELSQMHVNFLPASMHAPSFVSLGFVLDDFNTLLVVFALSLEQKAEWIRKFENIHGGTSYINGMTDL